MPASREHALRKRHTRSARHYHQQRLAQSLLLAWRQQLSDAKAFRLVLTEVGHSMRLGMTAEVLMGWRDLLRAKQWKTASMMR